MKIGTHDIDIEEPDLLLVRVNGAVSVHDVQAYCEELLALCQDRPRVLLLIDVSRIGEFGNQARRRLAEEMGPIPSRAIAFVGAGFGTRIVLQMVIHAVRLLTRRASPTAFFNTEAEARAWIEETRAALEQPAPVR